MKKLETPLRSNYTRFVIFDGKDFATLRSFYRNIAQQLNFPDYFSYNLDSLDELINDLSWIEESKIIVLIVNLDQFLHEEDEEIKAIILQMLDNASSDNDILDFQFYYKT